MEGSRAAEVRTHAINRSARAHQLVPAESRCAQARFRHQRDERAMGIAQLRRRPVEQRRDAVDGGQAAVRSRQESRALARRRRVPQSGLRGDSVCARDRQGLRAPAAFHSASDQQVLHHGSRARPQLRRVRGQARHPDVHDQLAQPDPARSRLGARRIRDRVQGRDRRGVRDQRQSRLQRARRMRRWYHDLAHARASRGGWATSASTRSRCWSRCSTRACPR